MNSDLIIKGGEAKIDEAVVIQGVQMICHGEFSENKITTVTLPDTVTCIGKQAFLQCSQLVSLKFSNTLTRIEDHAFFDCRGLSSLTLPDTVTRIGKYAFGGCSGLVSVTLPRNLTHIEENTFNGSTDNVLKYVAMPFST